MKTYFCVYPHCLLTSNGASILIFNPRDKKYIIEENLLLASMVEEKQNYVLPVDDSNKMMFIAAKEKRLGYFVESNSLMPFMAFQKISLLSSLEKERLSFGRITSRKTPSLVKSVSIYLNNGSLKAKSDNIYFQMGYPKYGTRVSRLPQDFQENLMDLINAPSYKTIFLCGDVDELMLSVLKNLNGLQHVIVIRTTVNFMAQAVHLSEIHPSLHIEMLINSYDEFQKKAKLEIPNSMSFTFLIHNPKEMNAYTDVKQKHSFVPVLYDAEKQKDLIEQMRLTFHDILDYASSMRGILSNGLIHTSAFGHITLDILGNLYAEESYIGNVKDGSAFLLMTEWLQKENNLWMLTRKTFRPCQKCILSFLCPCVSIYERQGYFETACVENLINDCFDNETYFKCK